MDFFESSCQSGPFFNERFGICDDQAFPHAYVDTLDERKWIAFVVNEYKIPVTFTAIDKCVICDGDELNRGRCDGMLTTDKLLYLIELKERKSDWMPHAIGQLESTIQFLLASHDISQFRYKKAFACNRKRPAFVEIDNETQLRFFRNYGFRLDIQAQVILMS